MVEEVVLEGSTVEDKVSKYVGRRVFCGFTKTGLNCLTNRPAAYTSAIPGCRRNSDGKIMDGQPCIHSAQVTLEYDATVKVKEDIGAIMGAYFGSVGLFGSGEADRDRINIPLNAGLPF